MSAPDPGRIRNFSIIAHIDHGKSTLADRLLEATGTISARAMHAQVMDSMELERERGITIKAKAVRMEYDSPKGKYILNLIDTPGHVDFSYEVSRALAACEGALLVVDASQGVEAQTLANASLAQGVGLKVVPVINKVDLPTADVEATREQILYALNLEEDALEVSAKEGRGTQAVLDAIIERIPPPSGSADKPLAALIFDSTFSSYRGVVLLIRVMDGKVLPGMKIKLFSTKHEAVVEEVGYLKPQQVPASNLNSGEVGYLICGIKDIHQVRVGDTIMETARPATTPLPGYSDAKPVVFAGVFPINPADYPTLSKALEKLSLEDSSISTQGETSEALGFGFRLGFLGLLHMDIVRERLEREFDQNLIVTSPSVVYRVKTAAGWKPLDNPAKFPPHGDIQDVEEPYVLATIIVPVRRQEGVLDLLKDRRGEYISVEYLSGERMIIKYYLPLAEMVLNFYDRLKSLSKGYASFDYAPVGYRRGDVVKLEILLHGSPVDALSLIVSKAKAYHIGRDLCAKLKELLTRQNFEVSIQASLEGRIIARETLSAKRKDVIAKCYGGDITRKRKLLSKQKEGKKRAKQLGTIEVPQEAFLAIVRLGEDTKN